MFGLGKDKHSIDKSPEGSAGLFQRLKQGLSKTRQGLAAKLSGLLSGRKTLDADVIEAIETQLLSADVGLEATEQLIDALKNTATQPDDAGESALAALKTAMVDILRPVEQPLQIPASHSGPYIILMIGINGAGKTTTIGKLAQHFRRQDKSVMLAAGDTFRAAAVEQLQTWGARNDVPVIAQHAGADSAAVIYDAIESATARGIDVLIADTAGRLHTQDNLMDELKKVARIMGRVNASAPHEVMLVLDAATGQNAVNQAIQFNQAVPLTGITLTKLDGTAKGGVIFAIAKQLGVPIRYIGIGEQADDLRVFQAGHFVAALLDTET